MPPAPKQAYDLLRPEHAICSKNKKDMTTNDNKRKLSAWLLAASLATALCGCSGEITDGNTLPAGKYPMTFTAQVDGLTATRATSDNSWTGNEEVAIQVGDAIKKYTAAPGGNLMVASDDPFYWQNTNDITVNAWYPYSAKKPAADALKVKADQSNDTDYQASDYLETDAADVAFNNPVALTFKHRTAKVVVTLQKGEGVTDVSGATVKFLNQTQVDGDGTEVISNTNVTQDAYTALLIPKRIQNKQFIQVTIGTSGDACDYYYTPTDINLEAGKQYSYTITVKKEGLQVTTQSSPQWEGSGENVTGTERNNP